MSMKFVPAITGAVIAWGISVSSAPAFEFEEGEVEKGKFQFEVHGSYQSGFPKTKADDGDDDDGGLEQEIVRHREEVSLGYGFTSFFSLAFEAEWEKERDEEGGFSSIRLMEIGAESKFVLVPIEGDGFGATFFVSYEESVVRDEDESQLNFGPILTAKRGPWSATVNTFFARVFEATERQDDEVDITPAHWNFNYAWQIKYKLNERFGLGVEGFGTLQDVGNDIGGDDFDEHRIGPVLYVKFGGDDDGDKTGHGDDDSLKDMMRKEEEVEVSAALGVLFGVNDHASDMTVKWDFEVEF